SSRDMQERDVVSDLAAAERFLQDGKNGLDVIQALARRGFRDIAEKILQIQKLRISGDYLQTSAVVLVEEPRSESFANGSGGFTPLKADSTGPLRVLSALNAPNDYQGPGSGYRLSGERWKEIADTPQARDPRQIGRPSHDRARIFLEEVGEARGTRKSKEIVI